MKKIAYRCKILAMLMACAFSLSAVSSQGEEPPTLKTAYDYDNNELTVGGTSSFKYKEYVFMAIALKGEELSENDLYNQIKVKSDGSFSDTMKINSLLSTGEYDIYITNSDTQTVRALLLPDSTTLTETVSAINSGSDIEQIMQNEETVKKLAMDANFVKSNLSALSSYITKLKPSTGYSRGEFVNTYISAMCCIKMGNSGEETGSLLERYSDYLGIDYEKEYNFMSETEKEQLTALATADKIVSERPFNEYWAELSQMTKVKSCTSYDKLMEYVEKNYIALGLDMGLYNGISNRYEQQELFRSLYLDMKGINNFNELKSKFDSLVSSALNNNNNNHVSTGGGGGGGGGGSKTGNSVSVIVGNTQTNNDQNTLNVKTAFSDMNNHWASDEINYLHDLQILGGYEDNTFRPDKTVTRGEFVQMICNALKDDMQYSGSDMFDDVKESDWYFKSINTAAEKGLINGFDGKFMPENPITRQDAAVILYRVFTYKNISFNGSKTFADSENIADYAAESVSILAANDIIKGYNDRFEPLNNLTRAEAGVLIFRMINYFA